MKLCKKISVSTLASYALIAVLVACLAPVYEIKKYVCHEDNLPFDLHWLISANIPHKVYAASAEGDLWACPENEFLSCLAADEYYESNGKTGLIYFDRLPLPGECLHDGDIGYHP